MRDSILIQFSLYILFQKSYNYFIISQDPLDVRFKIWLWLDDSALSSVKWAFDQQTQNLKNLLRHWIKPCLLIIIVFNIEFTTNFENGEVKDHPASIGIKYDKGDDISAVTRFLHHNHKSTATEIT